MTLTETVAKDIIVKLIKGQDYSKVDPIVRTG